jgi:hypothetical protein
LGYYPSLHSGLGILEFSYVALTRDFGKIGDEVVYILLSLCGLDAHLAPDPFIPFSLLIGILRLQILEVQALLFHGSFEGLHLLRDGIACLR